jgi:ketosteroid isomerase-like protein
VADLDLMRRYFTCLESGDFVGAAACFSPFARYSHPPYAGDPPGSGRHEAHGRAEILALFRRRGVRGTRHAITATARDDDRYFVSGLVMDADGAVAGSFVSEAVVDPRRGTFAEYAAYSSRPAVWTAA